MTQETTLASALIDQWNGSTAVSKLIGAPVSTVHSWRSIGIPPARLAHLSLVAKAHKMPAPDVAAITAEWARLSAERKRDRAA